jgi:hypothetical protein
MIQLGVIGPFQIIILLLTLTFPVVLFFIGYYFGKNRVIIKELKKRN